MGYRADLPTTNTRIEAVKQRIAERKQAEQQGDVIYINHNRSAAGGYDVPRSGQQGLRLNRKQRRKARKQRKQAQAAAIERMRYAMHAQYAKSISDAQADEIRYWQERALEAESRI